MSGTTPEGFDNPCQPGMLWQYLFYSDYHLKSTVCKTPELFSKYVLTAGIVSRGNYH
ncbi:MAG: hypothetical protein ACR2IE_14310 [Candidatus Sumerlaeaceae bacterium]